ncbi:MarR family winged helix-turn-helix transcriptional regulator [Nocardioides sp. NPDC057772]|uniref:MarR family winged helix-turn-helix transcriptional regulator n=1 Tax=Nocardioides sp. NPDC057772 TaxID=3346245 RepID=UPI0036732B9A
MNPATRQLGLEINALLGASRALTERSAAAFHEDLRPAAFHIARWLYAYGPAKPSDVAEAVAMDRSSTSALLKRMASLDLTQSSRTPEDGRSMLVSLTPTGRSQVERALALRQGELEQRVEGWPEADLAALVSLLHRFNRPQQPSDDSNT